MKRFFPWLVIVIGLIIILFPLTAPGFFISDDGDWMVIRLSAFYQSLREGQFPVRFLGRLNSSYGYPVANFLYPGYLYIGSFLHALGIPFMDSVKWIFALSVSGAAFFFYAWLRVYFGSVSSALGAVSFIFLPYVGFNLYSRGSVGELLAFCAVAMGLYSIAKLKRPFFAISLFLLILAHNSLALLLVIFLLAYAVQQGTIKLFLAPFFLALGMSAFFWVPALSERSFTLFDTIQIARSQEYFLGMGTLYLAFSAGCIWIMARLVRARQKHASFFLMCAAIGFIIASPVSTVVWNIPVVNRIFQFPFRFLSLLVVSVPFLTALIAEHYPKKHLRYIFALLVALWIFDVSHTLQSYRPVERTEGYFVTNEATTTTQDEYLPRWVSERPEERASERIIFYSGQGEISPKELVHHSFRVTVDAFEDSILQINTVYYPGWGVAIDSRRVDIDHSNLFGLMRVPIKAGMHTVEVAFRETTTRFIIDCISLLTVCVFVIFSFKEKKRKKK